MPGCCARTKPTRAPTPSLPPLNALKFESDAPEQHPLGLLSCIETMSAADWRAVPILAIPNVHRTRWRTGAGAADDCPILSHNVDTTKARLNEQFQLERCLVEENAAEFHNLSPNMFPFDPYWP